MTDDERQVLAGLLTTAVRTRFDGNKKAAYTAIGINPATLDRALDALPIRSDRATAILNALWPEARGELARVPFDDQALAEGAETIEGDFESWVRTTDVLSEFQRKAVLRAMKVAARNPGRTIVAVPPLSAAPDTSKDAIAADDQDQPIVGEQAEPENP